MANNYATQWYDFLGGISKEVRQSNLNRGWIFDQALGRWQNINPEQGSVSSRSRRLLNQYRNPYANPLQYATGTDPFYESDEGQATGYQRFLSEYGGSKASLNWLRAQESPLRAQFGVVKAANQEASWMDFLKNLRLDVMLAAESPYARGENPAAFLGRGRRSFF